MAAGLGTWRTTSRPCLWTSCRWGRLQQSWWRSWTTKRKVLVLVLVLALVLVLVRATALPVLAAGGLVPACRHPSRWRKWRRRS
jgi:hypothetical protein